MLRRLPGNRKAARQRDLNEVLALCRRFRGLDSVELRALEAAQLHLADGGPPLRDRRVRGRDPLEVLDPVNAGHPEAVAENEALYGEPLGQFGDHDRRTLPPGDRVIDPVRVEAHDPAPVVGAPPLHSQIADIRLGHPSQPPVDGLFRASIKTQEPGPTIANRTVLRAVIASPVVQHVRVPRFRPMAAELFPGEDDGALELHPVFLKGIGVVARRQSADEAADIVCVEAARARRQVPDAYERLKDVGADGMRVPGSDRDRECQMLPPRGDLVVALAHDGDFRQELPEVLPHPDPAARPVVAVRHSLVVRADPDDPRAVLVDAAHLVPLDQVPHELRIEPLPDAPDHRLARPDPVLDPRMTVIDTSGIGVGEDVHADLFQGLRTLRESIGAFIVRRVLDRPVREVVQESHLLQNLVVIPASKPALAGEVDHRVARYQFRILLCRLNMGNVIAHDDADLVRPSRRLLGQRLRLRPLLHHLLAIASGGLGPVALENVKTPGRAGNLLALVDQGRRLELERRLPTVLAAAQIQSAAILQVRLIRPNAETALRRFSDEQRRLPMLRPGPARRLLGTPCRRVPVRSELTARVDRQNDFQLPVKVPDLDRGGHHADISHAADGLDPSDHIRPDDQVTGSVIHVQVQGNLEPLIEQRVFALASLQPRVPDRHP